MGSIANGEITDGRSLRRVENASRLFDAAMQLLQTRRYDEISVEDICKAANVGRATFFRVYKTKSELLRELNRRLAEQVGQRLARDTPKNAVDSLHIVATEIADVWTHMPINAIAMAMDFTQVSVPIQNAHSAHPELLSIVVNIIEKGVESGELRLTLPAAVAGSLALLQMTTAVSYWFQHSECGLEQLVTDTIDSWLYGALANRHAR